MDNIALYISRISTKINTLDIAIPANLHYIEEITNPLYQLTDSIITQLKYPNSHQTHLILIKLLSTLLSFSQKNMRPQLEQSEALFEFLIDFIAKYGPTGEGEEAFKLFLNAFNAQTSKQYLTEEFIRILFDSLMIYDDSEMITKLAYVMIDINSMYDSIQSNLFLKIYHEYRDVRQIQEILMEILNKEQNKEAICKIITCLIAMIDKENKCVLYSNDLQVIIDIILNGLQSTYTDMIKQCMFDLLQRITSFNDYFREMYRIDELIELLEDYTANIDQSNSIRSASQRVLTNIINYLQKTLS